MQSSNPTKLNTSKRTLLLVLLIFALPALVATAMYITGWRPAATANHGDLIQPARFIEDSVLMTLDNAPFELSKLHGKWTMIYFDTAACPEVCIKQLYLMRQTHIAQGKDQNRLQRIFILTDSEALPSLKEKLAEYAEMPVLKAEQVVLAKLKQDFGIDNQAKIEPRNIYLLDPQGNLMMRYTLGVDPAGIRKDLVRLLKYSSEK